MYEDLFKLLDEAIANRYSAILIIRISFLKVSFRLAFKKTDFGIYSVKDAINTKIGLLSFKDSGGNNYKLSQYIYPKKVKIQKPQVINY